MDAVAAMRLAITEAESARATTSPRPWVGAVLITRTGEVFRNHTQPNAGAHAEAAVLAEAGDRARNATLYTTLEPCAHHGANPPCVDAIIAAGLERVVVAVIDPDPNVNTKGIERLRAAAIEVEVGVCEDEATLQLRPYLHHRRTGRPFVVLKLATTLDGRLAAPDGTSKWITGVEARRDVQLLRSHSDAVLVGAGTVRADDPALDVRAPENQLIRQPRRVVLGAIPEGAKVLPALEWKGGLVELLEQLAHDGCLQLLVEGGAEVAGEFHRARLVDQYQFYFAPKLMGGNDGVPVFSGLGASTISDLWEGELVMIKQLGEDVKIVVEPRGSPPQ